MEKVILKNKIKTKGYKKVVCPYCNGSGFWEDEYDQFDLETYICNKCKGEGKIKVQVLKEIIEYYEI
jgi:DnaJ-class molecular chaperone